MKQKHASTKTAPAKTSRSEQPVAPASGRVFLGVVFFCVIGMFASASLSADWLAIVGCVVVLTSALVVIELHGRKRAVTHPHPLYQPGRLPMENGKLKIVGMVLTLCFLITVVTLTVKPGSNPSPFPFFLAAAWIAIGLPQLLARRALRDYDNRPDADESPVKAPKKAKPAKARHKKHKKR